MKTECFKANHLTHYFTTQTSKTNEERYFCCYCPNCIGRIR